MFKKRKVPLMSIEDYFSKNKLVSPAPDQSEIEKLVSALLESGNERKYEVYAILKEPAQLGTIVYFGVLKPTDEGLIDFEDSLHGSFSGLVLSEKRDVTCQNIVNSFNNSLSAILIKQRTFFVLKIDQKFSWNLALLLVTCLIKVGDGVLFSLVKESRFSFLKGFEKFNSVNQNMLIHFSLDRLQSAPASISEAVNQRKIKGVLKFDKVQNRYGITSGRFSSSQLQTPPGSQQQQQQQVHNSPIPSFIGERTSSKRPTSQGQSSQEGQGNKRNAPPYPPVKFSPEPTSRPIDLSIFPSHLLPQPIIQNQAVSTEHRDANHQNPAPKPNQRILQPLLGRNNLNKLNAFLNSLTSDSYSLIENPGLGLCAFYSLDFLDDGNDFSIEERAQVIHDKAVEYGHKNFATLVNRSSYTADYEDAEEFKKHFSWVDVMLHPESANSMAHANLRIRKYRDADTALLEAASHVLKRPIYIRSVYETNSTWVPINAEEYSDAVPCLIQLKGAHFEAIKLNDNLVTQAAAIAAGSPKSPPKPPSFIATPRTHTGSRPLSSVANIQLTAILSPFELANLKLGKYTLIVEGVSGRGGLCLVWAINKSVGKSPDDEVAVDQLWEFMLHETGEAKTRNGGDGAQYVNRMKENKGSRDGWLGDEEMRSLTGTSAFGGKRIQVITWVETHKLVSVDMYTGGTEANRIVFDENKQQLEIAEDVVTVINSGDHYSLVKLIELNDSNPSSYRTSQPEYDEPTFSGLDPPLILPPVTDRIIVGPKATKPQLQRPAFLKCGCKKENCGKGNCSCKLYTCTINCKCKGTCILGLDKQQTTLDKFLGKSSNVINSDRQGTELAGLLNRQNADEHNEPLVRAPTEDQNQSFEMPTTTTCNTQTRCGPTTNCACVKSGLRCIPAVSKGQYMYCVCGCTCNTKCGNKGNKGDSKTPDILIAKEKLDELDRTLIGLQATQEFAEHLTSLLRLVTDTNLALFTPDEIQPTEFQCPDCDKYYTTKYTLQNHSCSAALEYGSGTYAWYAIEQRSDKICPLKFGWTGNLLDGLRCLSPLLPYAADQIATESKDPNPYLMHPDLRKKIDAVLDENGVYGGRLYMTFIENGQDHQNKMTAAESEALTKHAEAICLRDCPDQEMFITSRNERANTLPDGPQYKVFADRMADNHANRYHLLFVRDQFNSVIKLIRNHPEFQISIKSVQDKKDKSLSNVLNKSTLLCYKTRSRDLLNQLTEFQTTNQTNFEHLETMMVKLDL